MSTVQFDCDYNAANCVRSLISVTEALNEIIGKENEAIANGRADDIAPYQAEKARLAASHARSIQALAADRSAYRDVDATLLSDLRVLTATFEAQVSHQYLLLNGACPGAVSPGFRQLSGLSNKMDSEPAPAKNP
jgi:hypothetical protein